jgi:hypothetical protein
MADSERKKKLQGLLERHKLKNKGKETSVLFDECVVALGSDVIVLDEESSKAIYKTFEQEFKITSYGRIEWDFYEGDENIDEETFKNRYANEERKGYLLWSHGSDPILEAKMNQIIRNLDDVKAVSPDVWIYQENRQIIEIFHDGTIRVLNKM